MDHRVCGPRLFGQMFTERRTADRKNGGPRYLLRPTAGRDPGEGALLAHRLGPDARALPYLHNNPVKRGLVSSPGVCVTTSLACHSEESAILIGGRRGISHGLENTQSEIPRFAPNNRPVGLSHSLPGGLAVVPPRGGGVIPCTTHPCCVWTGWIELPTRACPFGTSQAPQGGSAPARPGGRLVGIEMSLSAKR